MHPPDLTAELEMKETYLATVFNTSIIYLEILLDPKVTIHRWPFENSTPADPLFRHFQLLIGLGNEDELA